MKKMIDKKVCDIFCISVYSTQYPYFKELVARLKEKYPGRKIIAGGPGATFSYEIFLKRTLTDFCVIGEGEITLEELLRNMDRPEVVNGIAYKRQGQVFLTEERSQIADLDKLPLPDRDFFDMERYLANNMVMPGPFKKLRATNIIAGRGCPYNCAFCSKTFYGSRLRSIEKIAEEIDYLKKSYGINAVEFNDELVIVGKKRTLELCVILKSAGVRWGCQGRINLVDEEMLKAIRGANCIYIGYGVESSTQRILDAMKKQVRSEDLVPVIKMTRRAGLTPVFQYMYGFPGEDDASIRSTYEFFKEIDHPYTGFTTMPLPGTEIYKMAVDKGLINDEEDYLKKITAGYNLLTPIVNLTGFSNEELVSKKAALIKSVNRCYYKKHPIKFLTWRLSDIGRLTQYMLSDPRRFFIKVLSKFLSHFKISCPEV